MTSIDGGAATKAETLRRVEDAWLTASEPDNFWFETFNEPKSLRRSKNFPGALAELCFGRYQGFDGKWIEDDAVVWLGMIASDLEGSGGRLLGAIKKICGQANLAVMGTPTPLKPRDWNRSTAFDFDINRLIYWYMRQGFRVVQDGSSTRVVFARRSAALKVSFSLA